MGATVFNNARVKSRLTATGQVAYLWEENTHCIKDGPKHASWCAMGFGKREDIVERIYCLAASIPGGMLKVGGRTVTAFVDAMFKLLDHPEALQIASVELENHRKGFYTAITDGNRPAVREYLIKAGRTDLANKIAEPQEKPTTVAFSLDTDFEVLRGILTEMEYEGSDINQMPAKCRGISIWRAFPHCSSSGIAGPMQEVVASSVKPEVEFCLYKTGINMAYAGAAQQSFVHVATVDGHVVYVGSLDYNHYELSTAVIKHAGSVHVSTGHSVLRQLMKAMEECIQNPMDIPPDARFTFRDREETWIQRNYQKVREALAKPDGTEFVATADELARVSAVPFNELRCLIESTRHQQLLSIDGLSNRLL